MAENGFTRTHCRSGRLSSRMNSLKKQLSKSYDQTLAALPEALKAEGFGVLTEIDVKATLKEKLDVDFRRYKILGACNPPLAHKALTTELDVGVMLPCNVVVYEDTPTSSVVCAIDPMQTIAADDPALRSIAEDVRGRLTRVLDKLT